MSGQQRASDAETLAPGDEDWTRIADPVERRRVQNRNAQRKFREKSKQKRDEDARFAEDRRRIAENQSAAGSAYAPPDADELEPQRNPSGLPWGSFDLKPVFESGRRSRQHSGQVSREGSTGATSRPGDAQGGYTRRMSDFNYTLNGRKPDQCGTISDDGSSYDERCYTSDDYSIAYYPRSH